MTNRFYNLSHSLHQNIGSRELESVCDKIEEALLPLEAKMQVMESVLKENGIQIPEDHFRAALTIRRAEASSQIGRTRRVG